jgi:hypothetical protein
MKLNFWQWIGVALLIVAVIYISWDKLKPKGTPSGQQSSQPAR